MSLSPIPQTLDQTGDLGLFPELDLFPVEHLKKSPIRMEGNDNCSPRSDLEMESVDFGNLMEPESDDDLFSYFLKENENQGEKNCQTVSVQSPGSCSTASTILHPPTENRAQDLGPMSESKAIQIDHNGTPDSVSPQKLRKSTRTAKGKNSSQSDDKEELIGKNRNAIQARINREKKKRYIQGLEESVQSLTKENTRLKSETQVLCAENKTLEEEVAYLKGVLANQSTLSKLLKNINNVQGVNLTTSFEVTRERSMEHDHDYSGIVRKRKYTEEISSTDIPSGGVCLHVAKNNVSLEFCCKCAKMANSVRKSNK